MAVPRCAAMGYDSRKYSFFILSSSYEAVCCAAVTRIKKIVQTRALLRCCAAALA